jgi:hypothetical protein
MVKLAEKEVSESGRNETVSRRCSPGASVNPPDGETERIEGLDDWTLVTVIDAVPVLPTLTEALETPPTTVRGKWIESRLWK